MTTGGYKPSEEIALTLMRDALPTSVPWNVTEDRPYYIAKLWLEAGQRRREAARLTGIITATLEEAERIEALAQEA